MIEIQVQKKRNFASGPGLLEVDFRLEKGEALALYGISGSGKTSLLRIIAGLESAEKGKILVHGDTWYDAQKGINLTPQNRKLGFVFQDYALFPNMNVEQNITFALKKGQDAHIVGELLDLMDLGKLKNAFPKELSGGQQQRVALARALVQQPDLLLLDEPLSALDQETREKLQDHLLNLRKKYGLTMILVSHDLLEIRKLVDQVMVIEGGKVTKQDNPHKISIEQVKSGIHIKVLAKRIIQGEYVINFEFEGKIQSMTVEKEFWENISIGNMLSINTEGG